MLIYTILSLLISSFILIIIIEKKYNFRRVIQGKFFNEKNKKAMQIYFNFTVLSIIIGLIFLIMYSNIDEVLSRIFIGFLFSLNIYGSILFNPNDEFDDFYSKK